ncbi:MAG: exodeoxyribonuclease VII small subunit [Verrucomicrobiales bacterium]
MDNSENASASSTPSFEEAMTSLEELLSKMEGGELSLEELLGAHQRGSELLMVCDKHLSSAQKRLEVLNQSKSQ